MFKKLNFKINFWWGAILSLIILAALLINAIILFKSNALADKKIAEAKEAARPANIDIFVLKSADCEDCFKVQSLIDAMIKKENVKINSETTLDINSENGKKLIEKFNITKAPMFIVAGEINKEAALKNLWPKIGETLNNNTFVFRKIGAPYVLISSGEIKGRVDLTMLWDRECAECHDVTKHERILKQYGISAKTAIVVDAQLADGRALIKKYNIELLPTIILTGDLDPYSALKQIWPQVGTVEEDGAYVFRQGVKSMGAYKDLSAGKIIKPE